MLGSERPSAGPSSACLASNFDRKVKAVASSTFAVSMSLVVFALRSRVRSPTSLSSHALRTSLCSRSLVRDFVFTLSFTHIPMTALVLYFTFRSLILASPQSSRFLCSLEHFSISRIAQHYRITCIVSVSPAFPVLHLPSSSSSCSTSSGVFGWNGWAS